MRKSWSEKEVYMLINNYNKLTNEELLNIFPDRTYMSIYKKARSLGIYKNRDIEFKNRSIVRSGSKGSNWKGGKKKNKKGYILVLDKENGGYILEHRRIMENFIGRRLDNSEVVHHINGDKDDNRIENLKVMTNAEHTIFHHAGAKRSIETCRKISISRCKNRKEA